ncbi:hypothetical protein [Streptosporangium sp. OZ121]|uniref:hypothetical protein n=1 Tax=Streptosporangium sp. OZ121 TaxID=3444183 RepID=UPI003F79AD5D
MLRAAELAVESGRHDTAERLVGAWWATREPAVRAGQAEAMRDRTSVPREQAPAPHSL